MSIVTPVVPHQVVLNCFTAVFLSSSEMSNCLRTPDNLLRVLLACVQGKSHSEPSSYPSAQLRGESPIPSVTPVFMSKMSANVPVNFTDVI